MSHLLAILNPAPDPQPQSNEVAALLNLSFDERHGYRLSASSNTGRDLGRWISDCPLTVVEAALLHLSRFSWQIVDAQGSLSTSRVLDVATNITSNPPQVHPRQVFEILLGNLPPMVPSSPVTGAAIHTRSQQPIQPELAGVSPALLEEHPQHPGIVPAQPAGSTLTSADTSSVVQDQPTLPGSQERELYRFLGGVVRDMRQGIPVTQALEQISFGLDLGPAQRMVSANELARTIRDNVVMMRRGESTAIDVVSSLAQDLQMSLEQPESDDNDLDLDDLDAEIATLETEAGLASPQSTERSSLPGYRPLDLDEVPPQLTSEQQQQFLAMTGDDDAIRRKTQGSRRQQELRARVARHLALKKQMGIPDVPPEPDPEWLANPQLPQNVKPRVLTKDETLTAGLQPLPPGQVYVAIGGMVQVHIDPNSQPASAISQNNSGETGTPEVFQQSTLPNPSVSEVASNPSPDGLVDQISGSHLVEDPNNNFEVEEANKKEIVAWLLSHAECVPDLADRKVLMRKKKDDLIQIVELIEDRLGIDFKHTAN